MGRQTFLSIVLEADDEYYDPGDGYKFSNDATFKNSDRSSSGIYNPSGVEYLRDVDGNIIYDSTGSPIGVQPE